MPGLHLKRWGALLVAGFIIALVGLLGVFGARMAHDVYLRYTPVAVLLFVLGGVMVVYGVRGLIRSFLSAFLPRAPGDIAETYVRNRSLLRGPRIVVLGGGTGMPVLLRGMKRYTSNLTAIVTPADDGGSSGRLRSEFGMLPPGDVRNCLLALAETEPLLERLFQYRFETGAGLEGHAFGNLFLAAMERITGDFQEAIVQSSRVLAVQGRVLTATRHPVTLFAQTMDGKWVRGESAIPRSGQAIRTIRLEPPGEQATDEVLAAIADAEAIVIAPGSLWTSILPVLLVGRVGEAIRASRALKLYVQNLMTQPGETDDLTTRDHIHIVEAHAGRIVDIVVLNDTAIDPSVLARYEERGARAIAVDPQALRAEGRRLVMEDLLAPGKFVRHDPEKLARAVLGAVLADIAVFDPRRRIDLFFLAERLGRERSGS